jgi:hypothetical protein
MNPESEEFEEVDINKYLDWIKEGRSFSDIRADLRSQGMQETSINSLIAMIDEQALERAASDQGIMQKLDFVRIGGVLVAIGVTLFVAFYGRMREVIFLSSVLTTIAAGSTLLFVGLRSKNRKGVITRRRDRRQFRQRS